ncbi:hypothetical protein JTE90_010481 [Oedothorax gibbosus]|uniref:Peptidase M28 domain-containing protein n=1 Tax=Oedothorax gibbosus TaxID=931172 RepID=A0AAV6W0H7_9ARAC|nr:hypothetical protein JTE90_010481 [Oedothorax gibbosus]
MHLYFILGCIFFNIEVSRECALPFWWRQQFQFSPENPEGMAPKTAIRYRSTIHRSDPNNYVHIQEYSQFTWWEPTRVRSTIVQNVGSANAPLEKDGSINGIIPRKAGQPSSSGIGRIGKADSSINGMITTKEASGASGASETNRVVPLLDIFNRMAPVDAETNGIVPADSKRNRVSPGIGVSDETNGMVPRGSSSTKGADITTAESSSTSTSTTTTEGSTTARSTRAPRTSRAPRTTRAPRSTTEASSSTTEVSTTTTTISTTAATATFTSTTTKSTPEREPLSPDREINENEIVKVSKSENLEADNLVSGASKSTSELKIKEPSSRGKFFGGWFGKRMENETGPCQVGETDIHSLRSMIEKMFSKPREHATHGDSKEKAREDILNKFRNYGLQVWTQNFTTPPMMNSNGTEESNEGVNLIGVIPGSQRGRLDDEIVLVGAHYDTVADSNGVDDNGSGLAVMLEVARAITEARCRLNHTLMFVAFDHEENGAMGSNYFVDNYLIPEELKRARASFQGAFILDGIMNYNDIPNTQELPSDYTESLPGFEYFVNNTGNRGNFLAMISRNEMDTHLSKKLMNAWQDLPDHQMKLFNLAVNMGQTLPDPSVVRKHLNFLTSDHATFWYHNSSSHFPESLNAVLLTDTGPFRGAMKQCYHSKCDDLTVITPEKLQFAKKTADALTATLVEMTSATAAGSQLFAMWSIYVLHFAAVYFMAKSQLN